jgi:hypothetical protein
MIATPPATSPADRNLRERLEDLRLRYRREEISLQTALRAAESLLEHWTRELWEERHPGVVPGPFLLRRLAEEVGRQVEALQRDLADVRAALRGAGEELEALGRRPGAVPP